MTTARADAPSRDEVVADLAGELRAAIEALASRELDAEQLSEAAVLARELRQRLEGPRRPRWYDAGEDPHLLSPESRDAYLEQSPIRGKLNPVAPPLELETVTRPDGQRVIRGRAHLGFAYEGPPHGVHGGWVAALFDEILGSVQGLAQAPGVTAILRIRYRHVTPVEEDLRFEGWIAEQRERRLVARATCHAGETLTADAEGIFVRVDFSEVQETMLRRKEDGS